MEKENILEVKDLSVSFNTYAGEVKAVRGVSFELKRGETLAFVGESGCGKTVTAKSILRLHKAPFAVIKEGSQIICDGKDVLALNKKELSKFRGDEVSMIFQDPMTSLNPTMTVGKQIMESLRIHKGLNKKEAREEAIKMLKIPSTAISVISAGLATGVGFAMKDLLENFFYGISLMTGRVRVGDFIECDGIRGKVDSITYQSTQVLTADGCVIAFLNSSLFSKNFKNITKNHSYEMVKVPVGVAYGSNVEEVRQMLVAAVKAQARKSADGRDVIDLKKPVSVVFDEFGDNSVNLFVTYWVLVEEKFGMTGQVKEAIYNTLNEHHIEIPFPQRDIRIIN